MIRARLTESPPFEPENQIRHRPPWISHARKFGKKSLKRTGGNVLLPSDYCFCRILSWTSYCHSVEREREQCLNQISFILSLRKTPLKPACCCMLLVQPPPQALRFLHGRGERETSDWWWIARSHGKGTDGRWSPLSPSRPPLRAHFHQKRDVWVRGSYWAKFETGQTFELTTPNISFVAWFPKHSATKGSLRNNNCDGYENVS